MSQTAAPARCGPASSRSVTRSPRACATTTRRWRAAASSPAGPTGSPPTCHRSPRSHGEGFGYANLAVRGRKLADVVGPQLDDALALEPDLVSIVGGGNDILRPKADLDALAAELEEAVARIRASGADVLMATPVDPADAPLVKATRGRAAIHSANIWSIATRHDAHVVDQWGLRALRDWRMWSDDRIHMTSEGHRRVSLAALEALGHPAEQDWQTPLEPAPRSVAGRRCRPTPSGPRSTSGRGCTAASPGARRATPARPNAPTSLRSTESRPHRILPAGVPRGDKRGNVAPAGRSCGLGTI